MLAQPRLKVFREILSRPSRGVITIDEAAGVLVYAIDDPSEVDDLLLLVSDDMREAIRRFMQQAPRTDAEWEAKPFLIMDGDERDVQRYRLRVRTAVEALRERLEGLT